MSKSIANFIRCFIVAMSATSATAATIGPGQTGYPVLRLTPSQATISVGETITVDLTISGFADTNIAGLSAFNIGVGAYSPLFSLESYSLGTTIGDAGLGESVDTSTGQSGPNVFFVGQTSNLPVDFLSSQLPDSFVLATFEYTALATTILCRCIVINASPELYDANGDRFLVNVINEGVSMTVVPLPAALWLFVAGLAALPRRRDKRPTQ